MTLFEASLIVILVIDGFALMLALYNIAEAIKGLHSKGESQNE